MSDEAPEDRQLLESYLASQSEAAFAELVRRHLNLVYYTALRRVGGDSHLAEDVAQSVFIALAKKAAEAKNRPVLAGWLYQSTRFAAAQAVRTERRRRQREHEAQTMEALTESDPLNWQRIGPFLDAALEDLSEKDRALMLLRFFENRPLTEVGARFSLSADAARMRIDRALEKLRKILAKQGVGSTSTAIAAVLVGQTGQAAPVGLAGKIVTQVFTAAGATAAASAGLATATALGGWKLAAALAVAALGTGGVVYQVVSHSGKPAAEPVGAVVPAKPEAASPTPIRPVPTRVDSPLPPNQINNRVATLDRLVGLSAAQKTTAAAIFSHEAELLNQFGNDVDRLVEGMPIRQDSRAQIQAMLTADQLAIYKRSPQRLGGGSLQDAANLAERLDKVVHLTDEQTTQAAAIYQNQADAMANLSPGDTEQRIAVNQATRSRVRALLTSAQLKLYAANPNLFDDLPERHAVEAALRESPKVIQAVGQIRRFQRLDSSMSVIHRQQKPEFRKGVYRYHVIGREASATYKVHWEQGQPGGPIAITGIEPVAASGLPDGSMP